MPSKRGNRSRYVIPTPLLPSGVCCICVPVPDSVEYKAQFLGALWRMSLQTHYERDEAKSGKIVAARWRQVYEEVRDNMACCPDTGMTQIIDIDIRNNSIKILMQNNQQLWINASFDVEVAFYGTPDKFDTDTGDTGDEIDTRTRALCLAVNAFVDDLFNQGMQWLEGAVPDIVAVAAGSVVIPSVPTLVVTSIGVGLLFFGAQAYAEMLSKSYRAYIACAMYENLQGVAINSRDDWNACLDTFPNPRPEPETAFQDVARDTIEEWARSQINNLDNYLGFVSNLNAANSIASVLGDEDCQCLGFRHVFDFETGDEQGWTDRAEDSRPYGNFVPGTGWVSEFAGAAESMPNAERLYIQNTDFDVTTITDISVYYTTTGTQGSGRVAAIRALLADVLIDNDLNTLWGVPEVFVHRWSLHISCDEIEQNIVNDTGSDNSQIVITAIIVEGLGSDPFD